MREGGGGRRHLLIFLLRVAPRPSRSTLPGWLVARLRALEPGPVMFSPPGVMLGEWVRGCWGGRDTATTELDVNAERAEHAE